MIKSGRMKSRDHKVSFGVSTRERTKGSQLNNLNTLYNPIKYIQRSVITVLRFSWKSRQLIKRKMKHLHYYVSLFYFVPPEDNGMT